MNRRKVLALGTAALVAVPLVGVGAYRWIDRDGFENLRTCRRLRPGVTVDGLTAALGQPVHRSEANGETWWHFRTPSIMAGPIAAQVSEPTGRVLVLRCHQDGPPTWTAPE